MISIVDYGAGNLFSLENALAKLGLASRRVRTAAEIEAAERLILPGVGHFGAMMAALDAPAEAALRGYPGPFLGICLGMQAMFEGSDEAPGAPGLGLLAGQVEQLPDRVRLPHMGWSQVRFGEGGVGWFYFAHSFAVPASAEAWGVAGHGQPFVAAVRRGNLTGVQFHPEKSGPTGLEFLRRWAADAR